ncbi:DUF1453 domain-containing protein [Lysobacter sp. F6437]|uniref:DUF1453 domain-containing protein n=1 Tax=Lysobacter sp. F6437 TaxID=3459296 RepID=UPI00403DB2F4
MPLLLLPLLLLGFALAWALLLPLGLWQRYRRGRARRRAVPWAVRLNSWLLLGSAGLFLLAAWLVGHWVEAALPHALVGFLSGVLAGILGLWLTRFEPPIPGQGGLYYTPNRWLVLGLTLVVAVRVAFGLVQVAQLWDGAGAHAAWLARQGSLLAVGGLLLGHYLAYGWGLRRRLRVVVR